MDNTSDLNIITMRKLISPKVLKVEFPLTPAIAHTVAQARHDISRILKGEDPRLLAIVGPCSIHDPVSALEYARKLRSLQDEVASTHLLVMRVYFEKPRTTIGWRGYIVDPELDGSHDIETGLRRARKLLLEISALGLPCATEVLDPIVPQYIADMISWAAIGARTTESQTHRDITSGLSMPVGFKNGTDGNLEIAVNALAASREAKSFIGIDQEGQTCVITTRGNTEGHVILRGGKSGPNYSAAELDRAEITLKSLLLDNFLMVDCSHANSGKKPERQPEVLRSLVDEILAGRNSLRGYMLESHLLGGSQPLGPLAGLKYGVSVTDGCLGWDDTAQALRQAHGRLQSHQKVSA
ncbi:MAG: 3-deoxy-7-phosphoheptulonate synthase [Spirochaetales bacterium]